VSDWNFADVWEVVAERIPGAPALVHGSARRTWSELARRADGLAATLLGLGARHQDKVAQYLYNCSEYLESVFGTFKAGLVPVNTNYRYGEAELAYLWDNADAVAVVFHGTFAERVARVRERVPRVKCWLWVDDGSGPCPDFAIPYETAVAAPGEKVSGPWGRSGDDLYLLYTGGTTGYPKGVMWRQDDLFASLNAASPLRFPDERGLEGVRESLEGPGLVYLPACPLMHGTGAFVSFAGLDTGGCIVTLTSRHLDADALLDTVQREKVNVMAIVGDAFAKPVLEALDRSPGRWDISSLLMVISSGVMWSESTKEGLLRHHPGMLLVDNFASSEALGMGTSVSSAESPAETARFSLGQNARVVTEDGKDVVRGSGEIGMLAVAGRNPLGYYKDSEKTERTFRVIDGVRYSMPGDLATVDTDGSIHLLGRGSLVINSGGEKIYPEEVEETLKLHPSVADAVAVGVPDERFGEAVVALVQPHRGEHVEGRELIDFVKERLAHYKAPRHVLLIESVERAPNGKLDYGRLRARAVQSLLS
jgi:acyl-CoA synthetase (AMP-forming)/AMP-acid ligase II